MEEQDLQSCLQEATGDKDIPLNQLPSIDLYLDQIIGLLEENQKQSSNHFASRVLTNTMINNYSKDGLLTPIKGKKYNKEQILQMLLVYSLKNTLSIGEIKRILVNLYAEGDQVDFEKIYERFLCVKEEERKTLPVLVDKMIAENKLNLANEEDFFLLLLTLSGLSSYLRDATQVLLQNHYPALKAELEEEQKAIRQKEKDIKAKAREEAQKQKELEKRRKALKKARVENKDKTKKEKPKKKGEEA